MSFKTKFFILFFTTYFCLTIFLPLILVSFAWALIAGWQIGNWGYNLYEYISNKYGYK